MPHSPPSPGRSLSPTETAALALVLEYRHAAGASDVALRLEHRGANAAGRACWSAEGCDPDDPPTPDAIGSTALSAMALSHLRPHSPRIPEAIRYLLLARNLPDWRSGPTGTLVALALAELDRPLGDGSATVTVVGEHSMVLSVVPGVVVERPLGAAPAGLRVSGARVFVDVVSTEPLAHAADAALQVERRWWTVDDPADPATSTPVERTLTRGDEIWVELTVRGAPRGAAVHLEDAYPGGLTPSEQPETRGPLATLKKQGGQIAFAPGRVIIDVRADADPLVIGYLARALTAGHYSAPPARAQTLESAGQSSAAELEIEDEP